MRNWLKTLLFISAYSPALLSVAYVRYAFNGMEIEVLQLVAIGTLGTLLPLGIIKLVEQQGESLRIEAKKVESNDFMLLAFIASYLLPFALKSAELTIDSIFAILLAIGFIFWLINSLPAHPILRIFRYRFYKLESSTGMVYTLISKRAIKDPKEIKCVLKISDSMLVEESSNV